MILFSKLAIHLHITGGVQWRAGKASNKDTTRIITLLIQNTDQSDLTDQGGGGTENPSV